MVIKEVKLFQFENNTNSFLFFTRSLCFVEGKDESLKPEIQKFVGEEKRRKVVLVRQTKGWNTL